MKPTSTPPASASSPTVYEFGPSLACPGDVIMVSGTIGDHGLAIMSVREGLEFETIIESDRASLAALVADLLPISGIHVLRDPTRGGVASSLNEIAAASKVGMVVDDMLVQTPLSSK